MLLLFLPLLLPFLSLAFPFHPRADYGDCAPLYYTIKKFELTYDELRKELWTNLSMVVTYRANVQAGDANTECNLSTERRSTDNISVTDCVVQGTGSQAGQPTIISNSGMDYTFHGSLQNKDMQILHIWLCNGVKYSAYTRYKLGDWTCTGEKIGTSLKVVCSLNHIEMFKPQEVKRHPWTGGPGG